MSLIIVDSVIKASKKHYPQTHLEEGKYETQKTKMEKLINDDLESSSSDNETRSDSEICWYLMQYFSNNKTLIVYVNHALLGFYLCQSTRYICYRFNSA